MKLQIYIYIDRQMEREREQVHRYSIRKINTGQYFGNKVLLFYKFGQIKKEQCIKVTKELIC